MYKFKIKWFIGLTILVFSFLQMKKPGFKQEQKKFARVKKAYSHAEKGIKSLFEKKGVDFSDFELLLVGYKKEKELLVYAKGKSNKKYVLIKEYPFCVLSGNLGPKRKEGDNQVPEGLYALANFNPQSNYHLSLKVNYPNASDAIRSDKKKPGGDIYIHGSCVSIGCIPITDELIEELYITCIETKDQGHEIPVYIFPYRMNDKQHETISTSSAYKKYGAFWNELKPFYDAFSSKKQKLSYSISAKGKYSLQ